MKRLICGAVVSLLSLLPIAAQAHEPGAHVHGIATLQVAVDGNILTIDMSSPLDNLIGFEHVPQNDKEKAAVQAMTDSLNKANLLFVPTVSAQCTLQSVNLDSSVIDKKTQGSSNAKPHEPEETGHADLDGEFVFKCARPEKLHDLQVNLFQRFPHTRQIKVEIAAPHGQSAATLTADKHSVSW